MRPAFPGLSEDARQLVGLPAFHLLVVAFPGLAFGLLAGPAQALLEDLADVFGVVRDAQAFADERATRSAVHSSLGQPWALAPWSRSFQ